MFARVLLWLAGLGFIGFGVAFLIDPLGTLAAVGISATGDIAATEFRAFYGGVEVGVGLALIAADLAPGYRRAGLWLCLLSYGGIGLARGLGIALSGIATNFLWFALCTELGLAILAALALRLSPSEHAAAQPNLR